MKKILYMAAVVFTAIAVMALAPGQRPKYQMYNCPSTLGTDENGQPNCTAPALGFCAQGTCTGTAPVDAGEGLNLQGIAAYRLTVCAPQVNVWADGGTQCATYADAGCYVDGGTQTWAESLKGDGGMQAYYFNLDKGAWTRNPQLDVSVTATAMCQTFPDFLVGSQYGRVKYVPSNVWVQLPDAGATDAGLEILLDGMPSLAQHWN